MCSHAFRVERGFAWFYFFFSFIGALYGRPPPEAPANGGHRLTDFALGCVYFSGAPARHSYCRVRRRA